MSESLTSEMEKLDVQGKQSNSCLRTHVLKAVKALHFFISSWQGNHEIAVNNFLA